MDNKRLIKKIGFMQGRLSKVYDNQIQSFPKKNWIKELTTCKKIGLQKIEWTLNYPDLFENPLLKSKRNTIKILNKKKIIMNSITCDFFMQKPFFKKENSHYVHDFIKVLKIFSKEKFILVLPLVDNSSIRSKIEENILIKKFSIIYKKILKNNKLIICFESDYPPKKLRNFIKKFNKKSFGINYDTGNSASLGYECENEFENYGERILNIHIKDRKYRGKTVRLGEGDCNFKKIFNLLSKIKYNKNLILQTARNYKSKHLFELNTNLSFIKKQIQ